MSLKIQNKAKLREIADYFGADVEDETLTNEQIVARIEEVGGSWQLYKARQASDPTAPTPDGEVQETVEPVVEDSVTVQKTESKPVERVLIRMTRSNRTWKQRGYTFTQKHPFALVEKGDDSQHFLDRTKGFRLATPDEAASYYN